MSKGSSLWKALGGLAAAGAASVVTYALAIRPWHLRWGTTGREAEEPLPGDALIAEPQIEATHAILIHAPAAEIWPWLVQWGYERGGFYSYDWIDRALGSERVTSAHQIMPEHQHLEVGDLVPVAPDGNGFVVAAIQPGQMVTLRARYDMATGEPLTSRDPLPQEYMDCSWTWLLRPVDEVRTRLVIRMRIDYNPSLANAFLYRAFIEPGSFIMERRMMQGIKERAERARQAGASSA
jgi:hypothetical protein